ncbi:hypothetical protein [Streptomyces atratus]|nr:hypothetical protein [Streptomyces atratus]MCX5339210.1 hypothetical protein [Streptomyces atratus]
MSADGVDDGGLVEVGVGVDPADFASEAYGVPDLLAMADRVAAA